MPDQPAIRVRVTPQAFDPQAELAALAEGDPGIGAVASFLGLCRGDGGAVVALELEHYPGFTEAEITRLAVSVAGRHAVDHVCVVHRVGRIAPGEAIVLAAAASRHRAAAFAAVEALMDYLKTDAPFWKKEWGAQGPRWVEPTADDRARSARRGPGAAGED